jgi:hypothetical protein
MTRSAPQTSSGEHADRQPRARASVGDAPGLNAAFDGTLMLTARYGVGVFARYIGGSVDLPVARDVTAGGFQTGFGLQARF